MSFLISLGGIGYGLAKEKYGFPCAVAAHMTNNFIAVFMEKYFPDV